MSINIEDIRCRGKIGEIKLIQSFADIKVAEKKWEDERENGV